MRSRSNKGERKSSCIESLSLELSGYYSTVSEIQFVSFRENRTSEEKRDRINSLVKGTLEYIATNCSNYIAS